MNYTISNIGLYVSATAKLPWPDVEINTVLYDSRRLSATEGVLFIAVHGTRHDGHEYIETLFQKGVRNFLVEQIPANLIGKANFLKVANTLDAFQQLATKIRQQSQAKIIAVTGSNGKTIVKEWLAQVLSEQGTVVKTPKSYNSQLGVPLSVFSLKADTQFGVFEAGISQPGEMQKLQTILKPSVGIFTNIGSAHQEYFESISEKVREKLKLFSQTETLVHCADQQIVQQEIQTSALPQKTQLVSWSQTDKKAPFYFSLSENQVEAFFKETTQKFRLNFTDKASIENALHVFTAAVVLGMPPEKVALQMEQLHPVSMRLEMKKGHDDTLLINDAYNNDIESLRIALDYFMQQAGMRKKVLILSEIEQSGLANQEINSLLENTLKAYPLDVIYLVGEGLKTLMEKLHAVKEWFADTPALMKKVSLQELRGKAILLKGARKHKFETLDAWLQEKTHETVLEINLSKMVQNLNYYRAQLKPGVKLMVMIKAAGYGAGAYELAAMLQFYKVDYLSVAYADEGVALRKAGINLPILVLNTEISSLDSLIDYNLEPEVYSFRVLHALLENVQKLGIEKPVQIHLKLETGMHRLGFETSELHTLAETLKATNLLTVKSVFSHLAAADDGNQKAFTKQQITHFTTMCDVLSEKLAYGFHRHILNSSGIARFKDAQFDMVRLGIGLYGISAYPEEAQFLKPISALKATVSQIKTLKKGESLGYGRSYIASKNETIATISIGYADGFRRSLSNGVGEVAIGEKRYPVVGRVCMDMCMINVTGGDVKEGDTVEIFGNTISVYALAERMQTIPYEVLTGVSERVKRVYLEE